MEIVKYLQACRGCPVVVGQSPPVFPLCIWLDRYVKSAMQVPGNSHRLRDSSIYGRLLPLDAAPLIGGSRLGACS